MKSLQIKGIILLALIMLAAVAVKSVMPKEQKSPYLLKIEEQEEVRNIVWFGAVNRYAVVTIPSTLLLTLLIGVCCWGRARIKQASVHVYKIDESEIIVHERDLHIAHQVAMGLINAKQLREHNAGSERALQLSMQIADVQTRNFRALQHGNPLALQAVSDTHPDQHVTQDTPSFSRLLESGMLKEGNPMILGFEHGKPREGSFLDIYSAAVAGESGSGKTGTLLYLIGSGIIAERVRFYGIDPHYPHPKSLGFKTKPLWEKGLMQIATYIDDMRVMLKEIEQTIDSRLQQIDTDNTPVVLVIDELAFLNKSSIGKPLAHTMERISTEGRKCAVYMLASSQTWLVARTGDSSVVRDTLTSAYVHKIKPKQANLLLQSKETSQMVEKYVKKPGECLLYPVCDDPVICTMPYTTEQDMVKVSGMCEPIFVNAPVNDPVNVPVVNKTSVNSVNLTKLSDDGLVNAVNTKLKKGDLDNLAQVVGVSKAMLSMVLNGKRNVSDKIRTGMIAYLEHNAKIIPFPKGDL